MALIHDTTVVNIVVLVQYWRYFSSINASIGDTFSLIFWQHSTQILSQVQFNSVTAVHERES